MCLEDGVVFEFPGVMRHADGHEGGAVGMPKGREVRRSEQLEKSIHRVEGYV